VGGCATQRAIAAASQLCLDGRALDAVRSAVRDAQRDGRAAKGEAGTPLQIPESELKLDFGGWLLPSRHLVNLHVRGLQLDLARDADGGWHVNGIGVAGGGQSATAVAGSAVDGYLAGESAVVSPMQSPAKATRFCSLSSCV
jgi:hypothetical protein